MDNDYIKELERRIEALENTIQLLTIKNHTAITISNCKIQAIGLEKCKTTSFTDNEIETYGSVGYKNIINNSKINHVTLTENKKITFNNCKYNNGKDDFNQ